MALIRPGTQLRAQRATVSGASSRTIAGTGVAVAQDAQVAASGSAGKLGSGALAAQAASIIGVGGRAPVFIRTPNPIFSEGVNGTYDFKNDIDDDYLPGVTWTLSNLGGLDPNISFDPVNGILNYVAGTGLSSSSHQVTATDSLGSAVSASFNVTVQVASASDPLLVTLPTWNDEQAAYAAQGLVATTNLDIVDMNGQDQLDKFSQLATIDNTHDDTEGDDLWSAYQMYKRLNGIRLLAAAEWYERAANLANFFTNDYLDGPAWVDDDTGAGADFCHTYGWGLCDWGVGESDSAALAAVDAIIADQAVEHSSVTPGDGLLTYANGSRAWARRLRLAVAAQEASPNATNLTWRDKVIDVVMECPEWDDTYKMYFLAEYSSDQRLGAGTWAAGQRICIGFHMGIWMDAMWQAWRVLKSEGHTTPYGHTAADVAQRLIDMASFFENMDLDANGYLQLNLGYDTSTGTTPANTTQINTNGDGAPDGVYSICPVNGLVMAYKFTGDQAYLTKAWTLWENWQTEPKPDADDGRTWPSAGTIDHYADAKIMSNSSGAKYLGYNKGELQYVYALFENNGSPARVLSGIKPSWYESATDKTWIAMSVSASSNSYGDSDINPEGDAGFVLGAANDHQAAIRKWNGAAASEDYYNIFVGGGHNGGSGNIMYQFGPLSSDTPNWHWWYTDQAKYDKPSDNLTWGAETGRTSGYYSDGLPVSRHSYNQLVYVPDLGGGNGRRVIAWGGKAIWSTDGGDSTAAAASFYLNAGDVGGSYDPAGYYPNAIENPGVGGGAAYDSVTQRVYQQTSQDQSFGYLDPVTKTATQLSGPNGVGGTTGAMAIDPNRRIAVIHKNAGGDHFLAVIDIDHDGRVSGTEGNLETYNYSSPLGSRASIVFHEASDAFFAYQGGATIYKLTIPSNYRTGGSTGALNSGASYSWSAVTNAGGGVTPTSDTDEGGIMNRFQYISSIDAFGVINNSGFSASDEFYVYKIPAGGL